MKTHLGAMLAVAGCTAMAPLGGCGSADDPPAADEPTLSPESIKITPFYKYYSVRKDMRHCMFCGGYFIKEVNTADPEEYILGLDFSHPAFDASAIHAILDAPNGDLVLHGYRDVPGPTGLRRLVVTEAFRSLPGIDPLMVDGYYLGSVKSPPVMCFAAPCDEEVARALNEPTTFDFTSYDVKRIASSTHVEEAWLVDRMRYHGALFTGHVVAGRLYPAGQERIFRISQVFARLPVDRVCAPSTVRTCGDDVATYTRNAEGCNVFDKCAEIAPWACQTPPPTAHCGPGYRAEGWAIDAAACVAYTCMPTFVPGFLPE